ncbi:MAG: PAS domain S-box protein, partial [Isosphaeraceae bacterium]
MMITNSEGAGRSRPGVVLADVSAGALPEAVGLCDRSGMLLRAGLQSDRAASPSWGALGVPEEVLRVIRRGCDGVAGTGRPSVEEVRIESSGGAPTRVLECVFAPVPSEGSETDRVAVILRDVTRARRAEEALRESERQYRLLAENATDMISRHAPDGTYLYVSPASKPVTGYLPRELLGRSPYELIHPDDLDHVRQAHALMLESDEPRAVTLRSRRPDGSFVWLETTARAIREPTTAAVTEIQCATRDVTPRKQAEQELREQRELLQAVLDNWPSPVYIKDIQGRYLLVNRPFETLFGIVPGRATGRTDADLFEPERAKARRAADLAAAVGGRPIEEEEVVPGVEGANPPTILHVLRFPLAEPDGNPFAVCGIATDVTARRQAEGALREKSAILRSVLDNMADGVIMADEHERFLEFNPAAERMFGLGATDTTSEDWSERYGLFLPDATTPFPADELPLTRAVRGESVNDVEMFVRHARNPEGAWVLINARPLFRPDGRPAGGVIVCRDVTERKTAEVLLRDQNARLREAADDERKAHDALKQAEVQLVQAEKLAALGQMVAGFAHEVNNPLAFVSNDMAVLQRDLSALRQLIEHYREGDATLEVHAPEILAQVRETSERIDLEYALPNIDKLTARSREGLRR